MHNKNLWLLIANADDCGVQTELDLRLARFNGSAARLGHEIRPRGAQAARTRALPRRTRRGRWTRPPRSCAPNAEAPYRRAGPACAWDMPSAKRRAPLLP